jgi:hypothetical protein
MLSNERRKDDSRIDVLTSQFITVIGQIDKSEKRTEEWRIRYDEKIDAMNEKLDCLPCKERVETTNGMKKEIGWLQKGGVALIACLFGIGVWVGVMNTVVTANSGKWATLEPEHKIIIKDIEVLKTEMLHGKPNRV